MEDFIDLSTTPRAISRPRESLPEVSVTEIVQPAKRPRTHAPRHIVQVDLSHEQGGASATVNDSGRSRLEQQQQPQRDAVPAVHSAAVMQAPQSIEVDMALRRPRIGATHLWGEVKEDEQPGQVPQRYAPPSARYWSPRNRSTRPQQHASSAPSTSQQGDVAPALESRPTEQQGPACDAVIARKLQEEEDRRLAHETAMRFEQEEDRRLQARMNAWEALEDESTARDQSMAGMSSSYRRGRSMRSTAPMFEPFGGPGSRRGRTTGAGPSSEGPSGGSWGPMSLSSLLLGSSWRGRHRHGPYGPPGGTSARGMRDMVAGLVESGLPPHLLFSDRDFTADDYEALCRLDEKVENRKGATQQDIDALPTHVVRDSVRPSDSESGVQSCSICLEDVAPGAVLRLLPCTHKFHQGCIDRWLQQRASCPICQKPCADE